jgi:iron complex outermembrane recepter protein
MKKLIRPDDTSVAVDAFVKRSLRSARMRAGLRASAVTVGLALSVGSSAAWSDESAKADDVQLLEEIVVTAQFREQGLQSTPVAITAVTGSQLEQHTLSSVTDLNGLAPNLTVTKGTNTNGPSAQLFIRGVGQSDGHPGLEPGVGLYVDDVYRGLLLGTDLDLTDLDRVEVLRGPQGTLAGKNSLGGSLKLFSKKPSDQTDGYVEGTYGDFNRIEVRAGGNFTLVPDTLYARISGASKQVDGFMKRLDYACANPGSGAAVTATTQIPVQPGCKLGTEGGEDVNAIRAALRWIASDTVEDNFIADATRDRSEVPALKLISSTNAQHLGSATGPLLQPGGGAQYITGANSYTTYATYMQLGFSDPALPSLAGKPGVGQHDAISVPTTDPIDAWGISNNLSWKFADNYTLTSITGLRRYIGQYSIEVGGSPSAIQLLDDTWSQRQFTEEVRLNGTSFGKLDWTVGGYYYDQMAFFGGLKLLNPGTVSVTPPVPPATVATIGSGETLFTGSDPIPAKSKSGFAHAVYRFTEQLSLIGGLRYTRENKDYTFSRLDPYDQTQPSYNAVGALNNTTGHYTGSHTDYRAGVEYQWTDSLMTYAQWSTGFRGGGVNPRPFISAEAVPFGTETIHAYEVGIKTDFLDHHFRVNGAGFYNQYQNIAFVNTAPMVINNISFPNSTPVNVGAAHIKGAELEVEARPFGGLQIDASASYLDFKFTQINDNAAITIPGVSLNTKEPYAPDRQFNVGMQYVLPLGTAGTVIPRIDANYQSQFYTDISNSPLGLVSGRTLANARVTWKSMSQDWETAVAVTNITDRFYYINKVFGAAPTNVTEGQPGAPREWLVTVRRNF